MSITILLGEEGYVLPYILAKYKKIYENIKELINNNEIVLVYFGSNNCNVCVVMKPKVDIEKSLEVSAAYNIFTMPVILLFI
jgi:Thioredoxin domain-containing protein